MRITTKYTYVYRLVGIIGCVLVLVAMFVPFVTLTNGVLQSFGEGSSPSGWELANLDKGGAWDENLFAYMFMTMYVFMILPPIGIIMIGIGKEARGIGYYLTIMGIFFLLLILFLMPAIQESIPLPPDAYGELSPDDIANLTAEQKTKLDEQNIHRQKILNMKTITLVPAVGLILAVAGGVTTYIGSRLVSRDSERLGELYNYYILLVEAHKGSRITKEEEDLLSAERKMHKVTRSEHEMLLRKMFPEERDFQNALYMHDHPVDMDRIIVEKSLQDYEVFLAQAMGHGEPTKEELTMLEVIRRTLNISMDDHYMVLEYLRAEGRIREAPQAPPKPKKELVKVPEEALPATDATPRYVQSWEYKSTITREEPLPTVPVPEAGKGPSVVDKTSLVPRPPKWESKEKAGPRKIGDVMPSKPVTTQQRPAPGPVAPPKKEEPEAEIPEEEEEPEEPVRQAPAPKPVAPPPSRPSPGPPAAPTPAPAAPAKPKRPTKVKCNKCGTTIPVPPSDVPVAIKCPGCGVTGKV